MSHATPMESTPTTTASGRLALGSWHGDASQLMHGPEGWVRALQSLDHTAFFVDVGGEVAAAIGGEAHVGRGPNGTGMPLVGLVAPANPSALGDPAFLHCHGVSFPYFTGAMANGIASADIVIAMGRAPPPPPPPGMLGSYGAAGLSLERIERDVARIQAGTGRPPVCGQPHPQPQ
jgi:trans-AT polyketide synthase/acyltransferase/oxidoreductase domain-containing protein